MSEPPKTPQSDDNLTSNTCARRSNGLQFQLRTVFFFTTCVVLYFGARGVILRKSLPEAVTWGLVLRTALTFACGVYTGMVFRKSARGLLRSLATAGAWGAVVGSATVGALTAEIATTVSRHIPDYFQWSRDWPLVLAIIALQGLLTGALIAAGAAAALRTHRRWLRNLLLVLLLLASTAWSRLLEAAIAFAFFHYAT